MLFLAAPAAAVTPDRFDLVCTGLTRTYFAGDTKDEPYSSHFRIDLATRQWCEDVCGAVRPITQVQEAFLELEPSADSDGPKGHTHYDFMISRTDGHETVLYQVDGPDFYSQITDASCKPAAFSGFPTLNKRF